MPQGILFEEFEEFEIENEDDLTQSIESFDQAVIWSTDWTTETISNQLNKKNIDLFPKFQRRDAWSQTAKSKFIESLILGLPIPQIILAEKKDEKGKYIVIDGKQRLLTIKQFFSKEGEEFKILQLKGLDILNSLNRKKYIDIENTPELNQIQNQIQNQSIRTVVIKNWPNEDFLFTVFLRLNTGSIKLSPQELRQALHPGKFIDFADDFSISSDAIKKTLNLKAPDYRMRDVELVIRYFSLKYFITEYDGNLKKSFDRTVKILNNKFEDLHEELIDSSENLDKSINLTFEIFGEKESFSKWANGKFQNNFNRAIFDIMTYYFSEDYIYEIAKNNKNHIKEAFINLCKTDRDFIISFEHTTKSLANTSKRLETWGKKLSEILNLTISIPTLVENRFIITDYTHG